MRPRPAVRSDLPTWEAVPRIISDLPIDMTLVTKRHFSKNIEAWRWHKKRLVCDNPGRRIFPIGHIIKRQLRGPVFLLVCDSTIEDEVIGELFPLVRFVT